MNKLCPLKNNTICGRWCAWYDSNQGECVLHALLGIEIELDKLGKKLELLRYTA